MISRVVSRSTRETLCVKKSNMMMHRSCWLFLLMLNFITLTLYSQKDDGVHYIINAGSNAESFEGITYYKDYRFPFRNILVIDKRFDSSKRGKSFERTVSSLYASMFL
jgi:hypothetical protein